MKDNCLFCSKEDSVKQVTLNKYIQTRHRIFALGEFSSRNRHIQKINKRELNHISKTLYIVHHFNVCIRCIVGLNVTCWHRCRSHLIALPNKIEKGAQNVYRSTCYSIFSPLFIGRMIAIIIIGEAFRLKNKITWFILKLEIDSYILVDYLRWCTMFYLFQQVSHTHTIYFIRLHSLSAIISHKLD